MTHLLSEILTSLENTMFILRRCAPMRIATTENECLHLKAKWLNFMKIDEALAGIFYLHTKFYQIHYLFGLFEENSRKNRKKLHKKIPEDAGRIRLSMWRHSKGKYVIIQLNLAIKWSSQNVRSLSENGHFWKNTFETFRCYYFI